MKELERNVLGAVIVNPNNLEMVYEDLNENIFTSQKAKKILGAVKELYQANEGIDYATIYVKLKSNGVKDIQPTDLVNLTSNIVGDQNIETWIKILQQEYARNIYGQVGSEMLKIFQDHSLDVVESRATIDQMLIDLDNQIFNNSTESMKQTTERIKELNEAKTQGKISTRGVNTGFEKLNGITNGWKKGNLIILGAASGGGKSALATNFLINALKDSKPVHLVSLEMDREEILLRASSLLSGVRHSEIDRNGVNGSEKGKFYASLDFLSGGFLEIDDKPVKNLAELKYRAKNKKRSFNTELLIVDYIQLINNSSKTATREQQVSEISRSLKEIARELDIAVMGLTQLNREHDGSNDPSTNMIRESSGIEHNADVIMFLFDPLDEPNHVLKIAKNRGGEKNKYIALHWEKETFTFLEVNKNNYADVF